MQDSESRQLDRGQRVQEFAITARAAERILYRRVWANSAIERESRAV